ncbi:MAG: Gfo/Idh/MocA family oxidoreductase [Lentisphaerae bacterium]|nr:Gfo/Idh/MocA family oxidoreductase [Lentisphaerota bacterium]
MGYPVKIALIGAGGRGRGYMTYAKNFPDKMQVVAVADPDAVRRNDVAVTYGIAPEMCFNGWEDFCKLPRMCDAVAICTQDKDHELPAVACAKLGYHILLEKPMAPTAQACRNIVAAVKESGVMLSVCHVLRYTQYTLEIEKIIKSGEIGDIVSVQHLEPVGYWHHAHSYVRGNWRNEAESSNILLAKCCHDLDWLRGVIGKKCLSISSFGSLKHFRKENRPEKAADRCCDCPLEVETFCPYSANKIYFRDRLATGEKSLMKAFYPDPTPDNVGEALRKGPYGRCVFACDNDVMDNQVVNMIFEDGITASFTMTAFNFWSGRKTRIFGTLGDIETDSSTITVHHFLDDTTRSFSVELINPQGLLLGHNGGDFGLIRDFVDAVSNNDQSLIRSGIDESLESHLMVFAAEEARLENKVCELKNFL